MQTDELAIWCFNNPQKAAQRMREYVDLATELAKDLDFCRASLEVMGLPTGRPTKEIMEALTKANQTSED